MTPAPPPPPRLPPRDLLREAAAGLLARPGRVALTVLGTVIGVGALVATIGLSKTAGNQIVGRFSEVAATDVVVTPVPGALGGNAASEAIPWDAETRVRRLNGVAEAGTLSDVAVRGALVRSVPINDPLGQTDVQLPVKAASPGLWRAVRAQLTAGRFPDAGHSARADRTAVLGANAARRLGITNVDQQPAIFIGDRLYQVSGLVASVERQPALIGSVTIPNGTARREFGLAAPASVQVETDIGAVEVVAHQAPKALSPTDPALLRVAAPPDPKTLRAGVENDLNALFLLLGGVSLLVGRARHRERHPRLGARAGGRDRPATSAGRGSLAHRGAVPGRERGDGAPGRNRGGEPRHPRGRRRLRQPDLDPCAGSVGALSRTAGRGADRAALGRLPVLASRRYGTRRGPSIGDLVIPRKEGTA